MKKLLLLGIFIAVILSVFLIYFIYFKSALPEQHISLDTDELCKTEQLAGNIKITEKEGSASGTIIVQNTSSEKCLIPGNSFPVINVSEESNVRIYNYGKELEDRIVLEPQQMLYSLIRYPLGQQCSGNTKTLEVTLFYPILPDSMLEFKTKDGSPISMEACANLNEATEVFVWTLSHQPIE